MKSKFKLVINLIINYFEKYKRIYIFYTRFYFTDIVMEVQKNVNLKPYNTLQIPVKAKNMVIIRYEEDIFELMNTDLWKKEKHCILNGGSNTLFTQDFDGIVVKIETKWKEIVKSENNLVLIEVSAWENWSDFVEWCCENNYYWIENLIDIPWNVWTAPVSNVWAYWTEVSNLVYEVEWIDFTTWENKIFKKSECEFGYRTSIFKYKLRNQFLVTKVRFLLFVFDENYHPNIWYKDIQNYISEKWVNPKTPLEVAEIIREIRMNKLPDWHKIWTAWSFFSNPIISLDDWLKLEKSFPDLSHHECIEFNEKKIKLSAWQLIDQCWLKWWKITNWTAWAYEKHALILINEWWCANDVLDAMYYIQNSVKNKFWVILEPEVVLV